MEKILLAVGFRQLEEFLEKQLKKEFLFIGTTVYREGVIRAIGQKKPDIVVIRETLEGKENILTIVYEIRNKFPKVRVVFIAGKREPGDALLATLVNYGVYDILQGEKIRAQEVVALIRKPKEYKDVQHLQPVPLLDEQRNQILFQAPSTIIQEKEVIKEVYVGSSEDREKPKSKSSTTEKSPIVRKPEPPSNPTEQVDPTPLTATERETENQSLLDGRSKRTEQTKVETPTAISTTKQKIITFIGGKRGVGTSSVALNTAVSLARSGFKTIFLEFEDRTPTVPYWYDIGYLEDGIDSALKALETQNFDKVEDSIVHCEQLKKTESEMQGNYKKFPDNLDFMFFSNRFLRRNETDNLETNLSMSKELFLYLLFQLNYDFIILDVPSDINYPATKDALLYSNKVCMVENMDVSSIGYSIYMLNEMSKKGINLSQKLYYIINQFEKTKLTLKGIRSWIEVDQVWTVPALHEDFVNANWIGLPVVLHSKTQSLQSAFQSLTKLMIEKN